MFDFENMLFKKLTEDDLLFNRMIIEAAEILNSTAIHSEMIGCSKEAATLVMALEYSEHSSFLKVLEVNNTNLLDGVVVKSKRMLGRYFNSLNITSIERALEDLRVDFISSFFAGIARFGVLKQFAPEVLVELTTRNKHFLRSILEIQSWVVHLDGYLTEEFLLDPQNAEIIIQEEAGVLSRPIYWPKSLSIKSKRDLLITYFESSSIDINLVRLVTTTKTNDVFDPVVRVRAERAVDRVTEEFFEKEQGTRTGYAIEFKPAMKDLFETSSSEDEQGSQFTLTYSLDFFQSIRDHRVVFAILSELFGLIDRNGLLTLPSKQSDDGVAELIFNLRGPDHYPTNIAFEFRFQIALLSIRSYDNYFGKEVVKLENLIEWFFDSHISEEFGLPKIQFMGSSSGSSYVEKIRNFFPELESALKQFSTYVKYGSIDLDLVRAQSDNLVYRKIPSLVENKYAYISASELIGISEALFSPKSHMFMNEASQRTVGEVLLADGHCDMNSWKETYEGSWLELEKFGLIKIDNRSAQVNSYDYLKILRDWQECEVISTRYLSNSAMSLVLDLAREGKVFFEDTLLTRRESELFNFLLNRSEFQNGPNLRNRYAHGSNVGTSDAGDMYSIALLVGILLMLKIEDDMYLSIIKSDNKSKI